MKQKFVLNGLSILNPTSSDLALLVIDNWLQIVYCGFWISSKSCLILGNSQLVLSLVAEIPASEIPSFQSAEDCVWELRGRIDHFVASVVQGASTDPTRCTGEASQALKQPIGLLTLDQFQLLPRRQELRHLVNNIIIISFHHAVPRRMQNEVWNTR